MTSSAGATAVLAKPRVLRLLTASLIGRLPNGAAPLALLLFARQTMPIAAAGVLVAAYTTGMAIGQPLLSRMADRWRQPPVMWSALVISTIGLLVIATGPGLRVAVLAAIATGLGAPPFEACLRVLWKDLVDPSLVHAAYTLDVSVQELIFIVGPLATVAAVALGGPAAGLITIAVVQVAGTSLFATSSVVRRWRGDVAPRHWAGPLRVATLRLLLASTALAGAGVGATTVAIASYAESVGSRSWAGWLLAAQAAGALIGGLASARRPLTDARRRLPIVVGCLALGYTPLLLAPALPVMFALSFVSGVCLPVALTAVFVTADQVAAPGTAAESFAWVATAFSVGSAMGAGAAGVLLGTSGRLAVGFAIAPVTIAAGAALLRLGQGVGGSGAESRQRVTPEAA